MIMRRRPIWPIDAPGMPPPGIDFLEAAAALGSEDETLDRGKKSSRDLQAATPEVEEIVERCLYGKGEFVLGMQIKEGRRKTPLNVLCGHRWGADPNGPSPGPEPCEVMLVGKMLGDNEINRSRCMIGPTGQHLLESLRKLGVRGMSKWYITNVLKTENPDPNAKTLKPGWVAQFDHLLHQELRLVRPKFVLCMGADAAKRLLGKNVTLEKLRGRVMELTIPVHKSADDPEEFHTIQVMACEHPVAVIHEPDKQDRFENDLANFVRLIHGDRWDRNEKNIDHRVIYDEVELRKTIKEAEANNPRRIVGVDAEWHGQHPQNKGAYLRCVQFSWAHKKAACVVLRHAGGGPAFKWIKRDKRGLPVKHKGQYVLVQDKPGGNQGQQRAFKLLGRYFRDKRVCGHFFNADLEWLVYNGLDLRPQFAAPHDWTLCPHEGGWDTALMAHAVDETDVFDLTGQSLRYTKAPRYDVKLEKWKEEFCREHGLKARQLEGYGECPDDILFPYACYDADVTRRLALAHARRLTCDAYGNNCWEAFWVSQRAALPVGEINTTGLPVDRNRLDRLTTIYMAAKNRLATKIRQTFHWPSLNLESTDEVRELMFGERYNGKKDERGRTVRLRPSGAKSLFAMPAITTDKRPKEWEAIIQEGKEHDHTASTNKMALGILLRESKKMKVRRGNRWVVQDCGQYIQMIRDYRFVGQVLKSVLRPPKDTVEEDARDPFEVDEKGNFVYDAGLPVSICSDGRVRTFISQVKETGRWSSSRPALQNLAKRREPDYKRILGDSYLYPLRSIFTAEPGHVLLEADYVGAELFGMAIMSGDKKMIEHAIRNQLPEDHPDFYDIHSNIAVLAFRLPCEPTKKGLRGIEKEYLRIIAKSVIFGVAYGRGAAAIALAAREEGITISVEEAQKVIDAIFTMYPGLLPFFEECRIRAVTRDPLYPAPRWLCGPFGRFRRFPLTKEWDVMGDFEREAMNFTIQGMIADAVSRAVDHLQSYRDEHKMGFKLVLQVHDALLFMVPFHEVATVIDTVLPECMSRRVPIYPCHLDGQPKGTGPFYLGTDVEIGHHWGVHFHPNDCWERKIPEKYAGWQANPRFAGGWECNYFAKQIWLEKDQKLRPLLTDKAGQQLLMDDAIELAMRLGRYPRPKDGDDFKFLKGLKHKIEDYVKDENGVFSAV